MEVLDNLNKLIKAFAFWYYWLTIVYVMFYIVASYVKYRSDLKEWNKKAMLNPTSLNSDLPKKPVHDLSVLVTMQFILWFSLWLACKAII